MRGLVGPALASAAVILMLAPAAAQISQNWAWCVNQGDAFSADQRISGCTSIIQSGRETPRNLAIAYYSRGLAYYDKGDDDRAIAEYNEAIRLDPKFAYAYSNRGLAYDHKGDLQTSEGASCAQDPCRYLKYLWTAAPCHNHVATVLAFCLKTSVGPISGENGGRRQPA
jgi:tetratricopeptide (TPR) repeat protein